MSEGVHITQEQVERALAEHAAKEKLWQEKGKDLFHQMMEGVNLDVE